jgi:hypothetical protein
MKLGLTKKQALDLGKVCGWIAISAVLDYLISITKSTEFGQLTPVINFVLVAFKKLVTAEK